MSSLTMYCQYRQLLTIAVLRQNKTPLETDLKCSPVSTTHSHDIYQKINTFSQFAVSKCCYTNNAIQAQYTKELCPNSVAASFEGCIQSMQCNNGFHVSKAPSNAASNIYIKYLAMKDTVDGSFPTQTIPRFSAQCTLLMKELLLRENARYYTFKCKYWVLA